MRPIIGRVLLQDDFSSHEGWSLTYSDSGSIAYGKDELTIAIGEANEYLFSIRESPVLSDFYLEITATPNLCRDLDEYGVLFRVSTANDYYRYSLSCDGRVRLDRVISGEASHPQTWMYSGSVPPGAPSTSRLGISTIGKVMKFFVNGQYQFSVEDPSISSGGLGIFARSVNKQAVTVNFSDLVVYEVNP
jgi:hypothetical protein